MQGIEESEGGVWLEFEDEAGVITWMESEPRMRGSEGPGPGGHLSDFGSPAPR